MKYCGPTEGSFRARTTLPLYNRSSSFGLDALWDLEDPRRAFFAGGESPPLFSSFASTAASGGLSPSSLSLAEPRFRDVAVFFAGAPRLSRFFGRVSAAAVSPSGVASAEASGTSSSFFLDCLLARRRAGMLSGRGGEQYPNDGSAHFKPLLVAPTKGTRAPPDPTRVCKGGYISDTRGK
eukprot:scaffold645_cov247-Pinguiococcus_pyrenoidosus.AAC.22